jgi:hypothetical protein
MDAWPTKSYYVTRSLQLQYTWVHQYFRILQKAFMAKEVEELCEMLNDYQIQLDQDLPPHVWQYIKDKKFLGMIIPESHVCWFSVIDLPTWLAYFCHGACTGRIMVWGFALTCDAFAALAGRSGLHSPRPQHDCAEDWHTLACGGCHGHGSKLARPWYAKQSITIFLFAPYSPALLDSNIAPYHQRRDLAISG